MNKLITTNLGGYPFVLNDLRWIDDAVRDAFKAIFSAYDERFIISGCELTYNPISQTYSCTEGYIYLNGEILHCAAGDAEHDGEVNIAGWDIEVIWDINGSKTFKNAEVHNTWQIRRAKFQTFDIEEIDQKLIVTTCKRLHQLIAESIANNEEEWHYPSLMGSWDTEDTSDYSRIKFRKDLLGNITLQGQARNGNNDLFTLPTGYRPARPLYFYSVWPVIDEYNQPPMTIRINTMGLVSILEPDIELVNLDGISFKTN
jgi:hypothetical protein